MKFASVVENIAKSTDLKRIAKAHIVDITRLHDDEVRAHLLNAEKHYANPEIIKERVSEAVLHENRDFRTITTILFGEVLLQSHDYSHPQSVAEEKVIEWEQKVIDESNEREVGSSREIYNFEFFEFVLDAAWSENNEISQDEKKLIEKIRRKLNVTLREYRLLEAKLGNFPKPGNSLHSRDDINDTRKHLQSRGLLLTYREADGSDHDVIPDEMIAGVKQAFGISMRRHGYKELVNYKAVRKKLYLEEVLAKGDVVLARKGLNVGELQALCVEHLPPETLLGGTSPRDGLDSTELESWLRDIGQQTSGTKADRISRIISHYDGLFERAAQEGGDSREPWFDFYREFAGREYKFLRAQQLIEKDQDIDKRFEWATDYLFETYLNHQPLNLPGNEQPDGALSLGDGVLLWDNKSKESPVDVKEHFAQFDRYFRKSESRVEALMVIAPSFSDSADSDARTHKIKSGNVISLITADELKKIALDWSKSKKANDTFPLNYFTAAGRYDPQFLADVL